MRTYATEAAVLAFGSAALLYLVTEELLVEAHDTPDGPIHVTMFFVGFIAHSPSRVCSEYFAAACG